MLNWLRNFFPERSPVRLFYHKAMAIFAAIYYGFPANRLEVIAVTGTSGKSSTVELIHYLLQESGHKTGSLSGICFRYGERQEENTTLRTTLRSTQIQKILKQMVKEECKYVVLEVSSHALDQSRIWGINIDTAVLTNISNDEHLDYHGTFADYVRTKSKMFKELNSGERKPEVPKSFILNKDDEQYEIFTDFIADKKWTYSHRKYGDVHAENINLSGHKTTFTLRIPNNRVEISVPLIGMHNLENILAAITVALSHGIDVKVIKNILARFPGISSRLEPVDLGQDFSVVVDFSYKPSALQAVLKTLKSITPGKLIIVWGGAGGRASENWARSGTTLDEWADEIILTTDDPLDVDPRKIASVVRDQINRKEGKGFFEIEDRYEAIRYAIYIAEKGDTVLIAGRGHEKIQTIGDQKIPFVDREICKEILNFARKEQVIPTKR
jgi:UDP-N-acetylmuramoyl-L-alanyl-D-glutamate--2,6-diaminopimelate ligase